MESFDIGAAATSAQPDRRLSKSLEESFRAHHRRRYRAPRAWLYLIFALAFGLSPITNGVLFTISPDVYPTVRLVSTYLIAPLNLLAFATLLFDAPRVVSGVLQTAAAIAAVSCALWMRHLDRAGLMDYPIHMLGIIIVALAVFGGYSWQRVLFGTALFSGADIWNALRSGPHDPAEVVDIYGLALMAVIAVTAAYTLERLARLAWLYSRRASHLARTDSLTSLSRRQEFNRIFPRLLADAARDQKTIAVVLLDVDHFKSINDGYGHLVGDEVLRTLGATLRSEVKRHPSDLVVRFGGEEVLLAWYDIDADTAKQRAEQVLEKIRQMDITLSEQGVPLKVTASAGLTWLIPTAETTPAIVVNAADELLYAAKAKGRDNVMSRPFEFPVA
ncbi:MAG TPA: GGDEF domain-containing protein [Fontimonas sp.]